MVVAHNIGAMNTNRQMKIVAGNLSSSTQKLSSGYKINISADNAAGLSISEKMRFQIRGLNRGAVNIDDGVSYCQVADGALNEVHDMLQRMNELSVQAANGTNAKSDRQAIDDEIQRLKAEMDRIFQTTKFNDEYIFKCEDNKPLEREVYNLDYYGMFTGVEIYNETCTVTPASISATYGGIVYNGQRTAWSSIDADMYDTATGLFREGTYTMTANDGTQLTFVCEDGAVPPKMKMQGTIEADRSGIKIGNQKVSWKNVVDSNGKKFWEENIKNEEYTIRYNGLRIKFTPGEGDSFDDVIQKLTGCKWECEYQIPHEETAVFADFSDSKLYITDNAQIKAYIDSNFADVSMYEIKADQTGMWIANTQTNTQVAGSYCSWASMGFTDWGDGSTDINEAREYRYHFDFGQSATMDDSLEIVFYVENEISLDSLVAAFDGSSLISKTSPTSTNSKAEVAFQTGAGNKIVNAKSGTNTVSLDIVEEYNLGRDFSNLNCYGDETLTYDKTSNTFQVVFPAIASASTTDKTYQTGNLDTLTTNLANNMATKIANYYQTVYKRYQAGAEKPEVLNLATLIGNQLTGAGTSSYLKDVVTIDPADTSMKITYPLTGSVSQYACAYIDFGGLGVDYNLYDLIGLGFNSTCQTCSTHYSMQFDSSAANTSLSWKNVTVGSETYKYAYVQNGYNDIKFYLDVDSLASSVTNGAELTNAMVDIWSACNTGFTNHFTQYATNIADSKLYIFDNRSSYATGGTSTATSASFDPFTFGFDTQLNFNIRLSDTTDTSEYVDAAYTYEYADLIQTDVTARLQTVVAADGQYVLNNGKYEKYDAGNAAHAGLTRVNITGIDDTVNINDMEDLIKDNIYQDIAQATNMRLLPTGYVSTDLTGKMDNTDNKVMITDANRPKEVKRDAPTLEVEKTEYLKIQCSSNTIDLLDIEKYKLSVYRLGLEKLNTKTLGASDAAINMVARAIQQISSVRSSIGAYQNRLEHAYRSNLNTHENTQAAESQIRDTDMSEEMVRYANNNILQQVGQSMLAQTNQSNQGVLALIK